MGLVCNCPADASIGDIGSPDCIENFGQFQKGAFQRVYSALGVKNKIIDPKVLASWTPMLAAVDSTKIVSFPYLNAPETEPGAARTYGGGNETLGGAEVVIGREATAFTGKFTSMPQSIIKEIKDYQCENVGVWMFDEYGNIGCIADDPTAPTEYYPVPLQKNSLFVGDKNLGGLENPDDNAVQWSFAPNWSDNFVIVKPTDFNPLTDLEAPVIP